MEAITPVVDLTLSDDETFLGLGDLTDAWPVQDLSEVRKRPSPASRQSQAPRCGQTVGQETSGLCNREAPAKKVEQGNAATGNIVATDLVTPHGMPRHGALGATGRKRSTSDWCVAITPRKSNTYRFHNSPFIEVGSSEDEKGFDRRPSLINRKGSMREVASDEHRRSQAGDTSGAYDSLSWIGAAASKDYQAPMTDSKPSTEFHLQLPSGSIHGLQPDATPPEPQRAVKGADSGLASPGLLPCVNDQIQSDEDSSRSCIIDIEDIIPKVERQDGGPEDLGDRARKQLWNRPPSAERRVFSPHQSIGTTSSPGIMSVAAKVAEQTVRSLSSENVKRRFVKAAPVVKPPPKSKHQQWLRHSNKILSQSLKHAGTTGGSKIAPEVHLPDARDQEPISRLRLEHDRTDDGHVIHLHQQAQLKKKSDHQHRNERRQRSETPISRPEVAINDKSSHVPKTPSTKAVDLQGSSIPENDRSLIDWKEGGMSWDDIAVQWQKKTGSVAAQVSLERRYKQARKFLKLELNGMRIARNQQRMEAPSPSALSPSTVDGLDCPNQGLDNQRHHEGPTERQTDRPDVGGKTLSNKVFAARMAEIRAAQEEEEQLEYEQGNAFYRDQSPQPSEEGNPVYFIYRIMRREWNNASDRVTETAKSWYRVMNPKPEFSSVIEANLAAMQETVQTRNQIGPHMRFSSTQASNDEHDMYHWTFEGQDDRGYEVRVVRELAAIGPGYREPEGKVGWFKKRVWFINKRTATRVQVRTNDRFEEEKHDVQVQEERLPGLYTTVDQANRNAAESLLYSIVKKDSARLDEVDKLTKLQRDLAAKCDELEAKEESFVGEMTREKDGTEFKVWVEQDHLLGPRNV